MKLMSQVERVTASFEMSRSRDFQSARFGLSEEFAFTEEDDRHAVIKTTRPRLLKEVAETAGQALVTSQRSRIG